MTYSHQYNTDDTVSGADRDRLASIIQTIENLDLHSLSDVEKAFVRTKIELLMGTESSHFSIGSVSQHFGGNQFAVNAKEASTHCYNFVICDPASAERLLELISREAGPQGLEKILEIVYAFLERKGT